MAKRRQPVERYSRHYDELRSAVMRYRADPGYEAQTELSEILSLLVMSAQELNVSPLEVLERGIIGYRNSVNEVIRREAH